MVYGTNFIKKIFFKKDGLRVLICEIGQRFADINVSSMLQEPQRSICGSHIISHEMMLIKYSTVHHLKFFRGTHLSSIYQGCPGWCLGRTKMRRRHDLMKSIQDFQKV